MNLNFIKFSSVRGLALLVCLSLVLSSCSTHFANWQKGALAGATLGAGTGAIIGTPSGNAGPGVAIGAGLGAIAGGLLGKRVDVAQSENKELEQRVALTQSQLDENRQLIDELRKRGADVQGTERGVVVNLPDILFRFDRAELTNNARLTISEISEVIKTVKDRNISIEGHTDSIGSVQYNKQLSRKRAQNVSNELGYKGVPSRQLSVIGYGEGAPIATNNTDRGRARNRRVEIIIEN